MASEINKKLTETGWKDLGVMERPGLIVLRKTKMLAVLVEAGFLDNEKDNRFFDQNFQKVAQAIADGILEAARMEQRVRRITRFRLEPIKTDRRRSAWLNS